MRKKAGGTIYYTEAQSLEEACNILEEQQFQRVVERRRSYKQHRRGKRTIKEDWGRRKSPPITLPTITFREIED